MPDYGQELRFGTFLTPHEVEIWIGAIGPRMLALTGTVGDGWLPSESYVPVDSLAERNARIDDAALAAGRDPAAVRRLYNVNPSDDPGWAERLAALTLTDGMSTFIVAARTPRCSPTCAPETPRWHRSSTGSRTSTTSSQVCSTTSTGPWWPWCPSPTGWTGSARPSTCSPTRWARTCRTRRGSSSSR
jgi:Luciferase-like monooxygenase